MDCIIHSLSYTCIQDLFNVKLLHSLTTKQYYVFLQEKKISFTEPPINADGFKFALEVSVHFIIV